MTQTATIVKVLNERQTVYRLSPAFDSYGSKHEFVVASASLPGLGHAREVLVFPSDGEGISEFGEIGGSYHEPNGHVSALADMGAFADDVIDV